MIMATHSQAPGDFEPRWNRTEREHSNRRASTLCGLATTLATFPILIMPPAAQAEESSCSPAPQQTGRLPTAVR